MVASMYWGHHGERTLAACIHHCHTGPSPCVMLPSDWCHHTPVTTVDELWNGVEAAWSSVPVHAIQSLFDSIPRRITAIITARGGCFWY
ncbi:UNVERIFIED_CONTAM: hypothetical protein NCL1_11194 [Trichonephila clavipes]